MPSYSNNDVILVRYPFSALSGVKVRPAIIVNAPHVSQDVFIVPLTSRTTSLLAGEFVLAAWAAAGLHVPTAVKRGTVHGARDTHSQTCWPADLDGCRAGRPVVTAVVRAPVDRLGVGTKEEDRAMRDQVSPPNNRLQVTANSLRSLLAAAIGAA